MPAFSASISNVITNKLRDMCMIERSQDRIAIDRDSLLKAAVPPDVYDKLMAAVPYLDNAQTQRLLYKLPNEVTLLMSGTFACGRIKVDDKFNLRDDLIQQLTDYTNQYVEIGKTYGLIATVFDFLNSHCKTASQVAFYFPGIIALLERTNHQNIADKLRNAGVPRSIPTLPMNVRDAIKIASTHLTLVLLTDIKHMTTYGRHDGFDVSVYETSKNMSFDYDTSWCPHQPYFQ